MIKVGARRIWDSLEDDKIREIFRRFWDNLEDGRIKKKITEIWNNLEDEKIKGYLSGIKDLAEKYYYILRRPCSRNNRLRRRAKKANKREFPYFPYAPFSIREPVELLRFGKRSWSKEEYRPARIKKSELLEDKILDIVKGKSLKNLIYDYLFKRREICKATVFNRIGLAMSYLAPFSQEMNYRDPELYFEISFKGRYITLKLEKVKNKLFSKYMGDLNYIISGVYFNHAEGLPCNETFDDKVNFFYKELVNLFKLNKNPEGRPIKVSVTNYARWERMGGYIELGFVDINRLLADLVFHLDKKEQSG